MATAGFFYTALIFLCSFAAVCFAKLAKTGLDSLKQRPGEKPEKSDGRDEKSDKPQPVYYIVEKKRARRASYGRPREIKFSDDK